MTEEAAELPVEPETTEEAAQTEDSAPQPPGEDETTAEQPEKKSRGVQKRLDELTRNWREAERRNQWLEQQLEREQQRQEPQAHQEESARPKLEDFESTEDWAEALSDWKIEEKLAARDQQASQAREVQTFQEKERVFQRNAAQFTLDHDDFDEVIRSIPLSESTYKAALNSEKAPELLYHLGNDFELASRIDSMDSVSAAMELGRIEASLARAARNVSNAPEPVTPVSGVGGDADVDPDNMTTNEWLEWREKQLRGN